MSDPIVTHVKENWEELYKQAVEEGDLTHCSYPGCKSHVRRNNDQAWSWETCRTACLTYCSVHDNFVSWKVHENFEKLYKQAMNDGDLIRCGYRGCTRHERREIDQDIPCDACSYYCIDHYEQGESCYCFE